jgi:glucose-6-phosphate 1-dehydrogenase
MASRTEPVDPFDLVVFGATGDLAHRKIIPSLYRRFHGGQMPPEARLIGAARTELDDDGFREEVRGAIETFVRESKRDQGTIDAFCERCIYIPVDARGDAGWQRLKATVRDDVIKAFYFSVGPRLFGDLARQLRDHGIACEGARLVIEKPFGRDLESARELNAQLTEAFDESQIYRIDHFLGKETVQNLLAVRFANVLFEPLWNARYVDHVQITVAEPMGVAGRGEYYDRAGAMRDMVQNHLMQLLCLTAMEPPVRYEPDMLRDEKLKVIQALDPLDPNNVVRGQYRSGAEPSYRDDVGQEDSATESFVALKVSLSNWRWTGVPFYLRTGKRLTRGVSEIVIRFRETPHSIFAAGSGGRANQLAIRLQPNEGIDLSVTIKEPSADGMKLVNVPLDMSFADALGPDGADIPDAYERLIMDVMRGNQTLFMRGDEVEAAWAWIDPIITRWEKAGEPPHPYSQGGAGPEEAMALMHRDHRRWRDLEAEGVARR